MPVKKTDSTKKIGESGTIIVGGVITGEDYNSDLTGLKGLGIYEEMRKGDATVRGSLQAVKLPILSTDWRIEPASEDDSDIKVADFIKAQLLEGISWKHFLRESLTHLDFGYSVFEQTFKEVLWEGQKLIGLEGLEFRKQKSVSRWEMDNGEPGIQQRTMGGVAEIPEWKLIIFTNEQEGSNYEGISILRSAYKHWYIKDNLYKIDAMATERQGLGIPKLVIDDGVQAEDVATAEEIARNLRANEESYVKMPKGIELDFMDMKANTMKDPKEMILHHDRQIMKNVLAQFLEIGAQGSSGSYSASQDHSQMFQMAEDYVASYIRERIQETIIKLLVDFNFDVESYPQLKYEKIGDENIATFSDAMQKMLSSGAITYDVELETMLRKMFKLPEMPDDLKTIREEESKDPATRNPKAGNPQPTEPPATTAKEVVKKAREFRDNLWLDIERLKDAKPNKRTGKNTR